MNYVIIDSGNNSVETSIFDVYTTTYFLQAHTFFEEHQPAKVKEVEP